MRRLSAILQFFRANDLRNIDDVAVQISDIFDENPLINRDSFKSKIKEIKSDFFRMNNLEREVFAEQVFRAVGDIREKVFEERAVKDDQDLSAKGTVAEVVDLLNKAGRSFEKTPIVYSKLAEEEIRDLLLGSLNTFFEGRATGETYSKMGKTDIRLILATDDILIVECKIWNGEKYLHDGIDQLFQYLTWRENFGIIIMFCKLKSFTEIVEKAKAVVRTHASYVNSSLTIQGPSDFSALHTFPGDARKKVLVRYLLFNLYYGA